MEAENEVTSESMDWMIQRYRTALEGGEVDFNSLAEQQQQQHYHRSNSTAGLWTGMSILVAFFGLVSFVVWLAILLSRKARRSPFNWYAGYLLLPSWLYAFGSAAIGAFNAWCAESSSSTEDDYINNNNNCHDRSINSMHLYQFGTFWNCTCNAWINALIVRELHYMLNANHRCVRYKAPSRRRATWQCVAVVYLAGALWACWGASGYYPWFPSHTDNEEDHNGYENDSDHHLVYRDLELTMQCLLFLWLLYLPLLVLLPCFYVIYVMVLDVLIHRRLPRKGQRRTIALYFFRIVTAFMVLWTPAVIVYGSVSSHPMSPVLTWTVLTLGHCQVLVTACLVACKPDVYAALQDLGRRLFCTCSCRRCHDKKQRVCCCCCSSCQSSSSRPGVQCDKQNTKNPHRHAAGRTINTTMTDASMVIPEEDDDDDEDEEQGHYRHVSGRRGSTTELTSYQISSSLGSGAQPRSSNIIGSWTTPAGGSEGRAATVAPDGRQHVVNKTTTTTTTKTVITVSATATGDADGEGMECHHNDHDDNHKENERIGVECAQQERPRPRDVVVDPGSSCVQQQKQQPDTVAEEEEEEEYEDVPRQSDLHYQFDDELDEYNPSDIIFHSIDEEEDESHLAVAPF